VGTAPHGCSRMGILSSHATYASTPDANHFAMTGPRARFASSHDGWLRRAFCCDGVDIRGMTSCPRVAKGAVSPVTAVSAGRLRRDLRAGRDRRDSSRSSRSHGGHGPTVGAVTAVVTSVLAVIAVTLPVLHARTVGP
jgi:hypothetical protein